MTPEAIRELERWISTAIEPKPQFEFGDEKEPGSGLSFSRCWQWFKDRHGYLPRSWATDEAANAMLRRTLPAIRLEYLPDCKMWLIYYDWLDLKCQPVEDASDLLAICLAFKAWKQQAVLAATKEQR